MGRVGRPAPIAWLALDGGHLRRDRRIVRGFNQSDSDRLLDHGVQATSAVRRRLELAAVVSGCVFLLLPLI